MTMPREIPEGGLKIGDTFLPAGYKVGVNPAVIHFDRDIFGADVDTFRPERWLEGNAAKMDRYMMNFGIGKRSCIGVNVSALNLF